MRIRINDILTVFAIFCFATLMGCGQKGDLYLPGVEESTKISVEDINQKKKQSSKNKDFTK